MLFRKEKLGYTLCFNIKSCNRSVKPVMATDTVDTLSFISAIFNFYFFFNDFSIRQPIAAELSNTN